MIAMPPIETLKDHCTRTEDEYIKLYRDSYHATGYLDDYYIYIRNPKKTKVLLVAHLDTVARGKPNYKYIPEVNEVESIALDDRLGVWAILEILQPLINVDILLTTGEESGQSTAGDFTTTRKYNWIAEFDRRGTEAVLYQYDTPKLRRLLKNTHTRTTYGTFSDISLLDHLGIAAINFGIGYQDEHSTECWVDLDTVRKQLEKFLLFFYKYKNTRIDHAYTPPQYRGACTYTPAKNPLPRLSAYQDEGETCPVCRLYCSSENDLAYIRRFGMCSDCSNDGELAYCELCDAEMTTPEELKYLREHDYICKECYTWKP